MSDPTLAPRSPHLPSDRRRSRRRIGDGDSAALAGRRSRRGRCRPALRRRRFPRSASDLSASAARGLARPQHAGVPGVRITAVCDIAEDRVKLVQKLVVAAGQKEPTGYARGPRDFERLCDTEDVDLVFNATPWEWHVPVCVAAMKNGKHAATEVPAAMNLDDCWQLVEHAEKHRKHCVMMENCNYDRPEMMVFNMVRQGLFGEILHAEGGYLHDLRSIKFANRGEGLWRRAWASKVNANLYPTHGLGPVANCMDINRGDRFDYLVSMSGPSRGLQDWAREHYPADAPQRSEKFVLGDVNVSLIRTARGKTIYVSHDTNLPRPYSRIHLVQGTKGIFQGYPDRVYIEGRSPEHRWEEARPISRNTIIRSGRISPRPPKARVMAGWTTSRTTG